jgi:hypothetical protein
MILLISLVVNPFFQFFEDGNGKIKLNLMFDILFDFILNLYIRITTKMSTHTQFMHDG